VSQRLPVATTAEHRPLKKVILETPEIQDYRLEEIQSSPKLAKRENFRHMEVTIKEKFNRNYINEKSSPSDDINGKSPEHQRNPIPLAKRQSVLKRNRRAQEEQIQIPNDSLMVLRTIFFTLYLLISFSILGLTLFLILTKTSRATPPLFKYTLFVICFAIVMFPIIVLSRHKASIVFMGILVLIFLATSALAVVLAMAPLKTCGDPSYVEAHSLTDNVPLRCQLVQAECALLWLGRCSFRD
jgi:membrane-associated HD superfamily phosphohydrolase